MKYYRVKYIKNNILCVDYFKEGEIPKNVVEIKEISKEYYSQKIKDVKNSTIIIL